MLTLEQKSSLKNLVNSPQWQIVVFLAEEYIKHVQERSTLQESDWETLKQTCLKEGEVQGIRNFIQEIFNNLN